MKDTIHHIVAEGDINQLLAEVRPVMVPNPTIILLSARRLIRNVDPDLPAPSCAKSSTARTPGVS